MDVICLNPNNADFLVKSTELDIYINDSLVGHTSLDTNIKAPKLSEFVLPVSAKIKTNSLLSNAFSFLFNKEAAIKISGTIRAGTYGLYKNFKINYQTQQKLN
ncbi:MAG: LEA type 2 family protein [Sphingobacteriales bacterium]